VDKYLGSEFLLNTKNGVNHMYKRVFVIFFISTFLCCSYTASLFSQTEPFYKSKTITIVTGYSTGGTMDGWSRLMAQYLGKHMPGNPGVVVQNMPGGGSMVAANYVYKVARPDGLTLGLFGPGLFFGQLIGQKEVQFQWEKFSWIGSPELTDESLYVRADTNYKTLEDIRKAPGQVRCGAGNRGSSSYYIPKIVEDIAGVKFNMVTGYPGTADANLALEKGEIHCRATSLGSVFGAEPGRTWLKNGFINVLVHTAAKRDPRMPDVPTIYDLMNRYKPPEATQRLVKVVVSPGNIGRPFVAPPDTPSERVKLLREGFAKAMKDPELLAEAKRRDWDAEHQRGEELEALAREVTNQPPEVIEKLKSLLRD
jgi:tripartite-type tricarboxylate transporter receptor subunit TctC